MEKERETVREDPQTETKDDRFDHIQTNSQYTTKKHPGKQTQKQM